MSKLTLITGPGAHRGLALQMLHQWGALSADRLALLAEPYVSLAIPAWNAVLQQLRQQGDASHIPNDGRYQLTPTGETRAKWLRRSRRIWCLPTLPQATVETEHLHLILADTGEWLPVQPEWMGRHPEPFLVCQQLPHMLNHVLAEYLTERGYPLAEPLGAKRLIVAPYELTMWLPFALCIIHHGAISAVRCHQSGKLPFYIGSHAPRKEQLCRDVNRSTVPKNPRNPKPKCA